jgi:hypothetical protein
MIINFYEGHRVFCGDEEMRKDIYDMFHDYGQSFKLRWGRIFASGPKAAEEALEKKAQEFKCKQSVKDGYIIWRGRGGKIEAMFCIRPDNKKPSAIGKIYKKIEKTECPLTFVVVEQYGDGPGNYDIFRLSQVSYLEHNNRARYRPR